jgi:hypothetical protein
MKKPAWNPYWLNKNRQRILGRDKQLCIVMSILVIHLNPIHLDLIHLDPKL